MQLSFSEGARPRASGTSNPYRHDTVLAAVRIEELERENASLRTLAFTLFGFLLGLGALAGWWLAMLLRLQ